MNVYNSRAYRMAYVCHLNISALNPVVMNGRKQVIRSRYLVAKPWGGCFPCDAVTQMSSTLQTYVRFRDTLQKLVGQLPPDWERN